MLYTCGIAILQELKSHMWLVLSRGQQRSSVSFRVSWVMLCTDNSKMSILKTPKLKSLFKLYALRRSTGSSGHCSNSGTQAPSQHSIKVHRKSRSWALAIIHFHLKPTCIISAHIYFSKATCVAKGDAKGNLTTCPKELRATNMWYRTITILISKHHESSNVKS